MSLLGRLKPVRMTTLYYGVLLAMISTLTISFLVFRTISDHMQRIHIIPIFDRFDEVLVETARAILKNNGQQALANYLTKLDGIFGDSHYLLNSHGLDLVSGVSRAAFLPPPPASKWRVVAHGQSIISHRSEDGQYWFASVGRHYEPKIWSFLPYYFLVIGATGVLCWLASAGVISPIRRIAGSIALFGQGDLSVRVHTNRHDEIGQLSSSFNQTAERLQRLILNERRLLGDISHELRSPLARLKFAVKLARTSPDRIAAFDRIDRDVDRITSLVSDILEMTFVEGEPAVQHTKLAAVGDILNEVVSDCVINAEARGCRIEFTKRCSGESIVHGELLRRAVENVLRNGIRYSPERSNIEVSLTGDSGNLHIAVRDYGPGVPEESLPRIFDPFFRVEEARDTTNGGGSGLGLSIAKRAVQVHHGTITAENASPGLRVQITIPLSENGSSNGYGSTK
jgi:signal transduction histidine kinase